MRLLVLLGLVLPLAACFEPPDPSVVSLEEQELRKACWRGERASCTRLREIEDVQNALRTRPTDPLERTYLDPVSRTSTVRDRVPGGVREETSTCIRGFDTTLICRSF